MKRLNLTLFFGLSLVHGDIQIERSPTYFRDQLEISQVAKIPIIDFKKLQEELLEHKDLYAKFFIFKKSDEIQTLQDKKQQEIQKKLLKKLIVEDFLRGPIGVKELEEGEEHTIVSLTSWPLRIHTVFLTIESLLRQSHKAHKVLLYLSEEEFPTKELPETLKVQQTRGLEVRWVKENLRSYKKLLYALKDFPESNIITVDDDCFYFDDFSKLLLELHKEEPRQILAFYAHSPNDSIKISSGRGGILYPSYVFNDFVFDTATIKSINPVTDDAWFSCAAAFNEKHIISIGSKKYCSFLDDRESLSKEYSIFVYKNVKKVHIYRHFCMEYFKLYNKFKLHPDTDLLLYLEQNRTGI